MYRCSYKQRLAAGDDAVEAFVLSSQAAVDGAESTKDMQAQVAFLFYHFLLLIFEFQMLFSPLLSMDIWENTEACFWEICRKPLKLHVWPYAVIHRSGLEKYHYLLHFLISTNRKHSIIYIIGELGYP